MGNNGIFSIGHSTHSIEGFVALLKRHGIDVVADVRSAPFSKYNPQFNKDNIKASLNEADIKYAFFGKELGGRSDDPSHYVDGQVQYDRLAGRDGFQQAISRLLKGAADHRIALMCSEKDPMNCHRTHLVSEALAKAAQQAGQVCDVQHIVVGEGLAGSADGGIGGGVERGIGGDVGRDANGGVEGGVDRCTNGGADGGIDDSIGSGLKSHGEMMEELRRSEAAAAGQEDFFMDELTKSAVKEHSGKIAHRKKMRGSFK